MNTTAAWRWQKNKENLRTATVVRKRIRLKKRKQNHRVKQDSKNQCNTRVAGITGKEREKRAEKIFEETMAENFEQN